MQPWLLYPVFGVLALAAAGGGYQTLRGATEDAATPLAGQRLIDVGGHRLNIRCSGSGSPTVILEPGLGESARAMSRWIAPDVARTTTICGYDRAGHGRRDAARAGGADAARDLHVLLERAHVPGPFVLAGHSLGGMFALSYAERHPAQVGGIVLLDSMHPHQDNTFAGTGSAAGWASEQNDLATLSSHSVHRTVAGSTHASLIEDKGDAAQSSRAIADVVRAVRKEHG
jgi:pimeloyl-ACP methyl ester carboxylesterase